MIKDYADYILQTGKIAFTAKDACDTLKISRTALAMAVSRLKQKGQLAVPYRDFYLPIPPEFRQVGCLPAEQLLPPLMQHIGCPYYVALLSAAAFYGAAHQRPQIMQVISSKRLHPIRCGMTIIKFIYKANMLLLPTTKKTVRTGYLTIASPETTAMDLLLYPKHAQGLNHTATVLAELIENIDSTQIKKLAEKSIQNAWFQRLGYIIENIDTDFPQKQNKICTSLQKLYKLKKTSLIPLIPGNKKNYPKDKKWKIIVNATLESDL